jgi:hypothetical protein
MRSEARGSVGKAAPDSTVTWSAFSSAVALLTRQITCPDVSRADLLDGQDAAEVAGVLEIVAAVALELVFPADRGAEFLQRLGLAAARRAAGGTEGGAR